MPLSDRDYIRGEHPPACTCAECTEKRLKEVQRKQNKSRFQRKQKSATRSDSTNTSSVSKGKERLDIQSSREITPTNNSVKLLQYNLPSWFYIILCICIFSIAGLGIAIYVGNFIPFWLLFWVSIIFSIEKWFFFVIRRYVIIGRIYKLFLNLFLLVLLGIIVISGINLFSGQLHHTPLVDSLVFFGEIACFIWLWTIFSKNRMRRPSMKLTIFATIAVFLVLAFAGVEPFVSYKNNLISEWTKVQVFFNDTLTTSFIEQEENPQVVIVEGEKVEKQKYNIPEPTTIPTPSVVIPSLHTPVLTISYEEMFNEYRLSHGLNALLFTDDLNRIAELRLAELQVDYSHSSVGNYNLHLAENINMISFGPLSDSDTLSSWKNSPGHNANMLDPTYRYTGYASGGGYAVQVFTEYITLNGEPQLPPGWYWSD